MKKIAAIVLAAMALVVGCASSKDQISIAAAYPFEGRYGNDVEIRVDGRKISYSESVWILSNKTLYSLLTSANPKKRDPILLSNGFENTTSIFEVPSIKRGDIDDFCNEVYVWETWTVSTNEVSFK